MSLEDLLAKRLIVGEKEVGLTRGRDCGLLTHARKWISTTAEIRDTAQGLEDQSAVWLLSRWAIPIFVH